MGCCGSTESQSPAKQNDAVQHNEKTKDVNERAEFQKEDNLVESNKNNNDGRSVPLQGSLELIIPKPTRARNSVGKKGSMKTNEKKQLKQVQAWGKKTSATAKDFLEDLRTQQTEITSEVYEQEYEIREADDTATFIQGRDSGLIIDDESMSELSDMDSSSNQVLQVEQEESFDVSKIIDVEKFKAANVGEKNGDSENNKNEVGLNFVESQMISSSKEGEHEGTSNDDVYNEDDKNLIESIEKEYLITQDNFLPGQIVN